MSDLWTLLQTQASEADHPYDTRFLHHLDDRTSWILRYRGNSITINNRGGSSDPTGWNEERPFASSDWASILHFPYYVNPGLETIRLSLYCRVSDHYYDVGAESLHSPDDVEVRVRLLGQDGNVTTTISPVWQGGSPDGTPPDWQWVEFELDLGNWAGVNAENGIWTHFVWEIRSSIYFDGQDGSTTGLIANSSYTYEDQRRVSVVDSAFYQEVSPSTSAPYDSTHGGNEVTATVLKDGFGNAIGVWDHLKRNDADTMWVYPRTIPDDGSATTAYKGSLAYLQWRSVTLTEVYDSGTGVNAADKLTHAPTRANVPARTGRRLNAANSRRQIVAGPHHGFLPDSSSRWDTVSYMMRCPWATGDGTTATVYEQIGQVHGDVTEVTFRPIISPIYYAQNFRWGLVSTRYSLDTTDSYLELSEKSVEAHVRIYADVSQLSGGSWSSIGSDDIYHRCYYVMTAADGPSHHLLAVQKQFDTSTGDGDGFVYREGMLDLPIDLGPLTAPVNNPEITVSLSGLDPLRPIRVRLQLEVIDSGDATYGASFLDLETANQVARDTNGTPLWSNMHCLLLGFSAWSDR